MPIVALNGVSRFYGAVEIFSGVSLGIERGDRLALVGANGVGKTTLLRLLAGLDRPDKGTVSFSRGLRIGYLPQEARFRSDRTLREAMLGVFTVLRQQATRLRELEAQLEASGSNPAEWQPEVLAEYTTLMAGFEERGGYTIENRVEQVLSGLGFPREAWDQPAQRLSGGQRTRAQLGRLLLEQPDLLLLDEPTNHLDTATAEWLENFLGSWAGGLLIVSHDRYFLDHTTTRTLELVGGALESYPGRYSRYVELRAQRYTRQDKEHRAQQEEIARTEEFIRRFKAGSRAKQAQSREARLTRLERVHKAPRPQDLHLRLDMSGDSGEVILNTLRLRVGFPGHQLLHVPNTQVERGARIALVGPNGAGKSTLLRTLVSELRPLAGVYQWGVNVEVGYYAQGHEKLGMDHTVMEELQGERSMSEEEARSYLARFLFTGDDVLKRVGDLSGGERSRVALARLTLQRANVLLLDEPTNHLDIMARQALEGVLRAYPGSLIFVSHDRYFIDALATAVWAVEGGIIRMYRGGYADYLRNRDKGLFQPELPEPVPPAVGSRRAGRSSRASSASSQRDVAAGQPLARVRRGPRAAADERLIPVLERLDTLEREEERLLGQITAPGGFDLPHLLSVSEQYAAAQEGLAAQDATLLTTLREMLTSSTE